MNGSVSRCETSHWRNNGIETACHAALTAVQARLRSTDQLVAFLDDVYVRGPSEHTASQFHIVCEALLRHANICVHLGKTRAWNSAGEEPPGLLSALPPDPTNPCWTSNFAGRGRGTLGRCRN